MGALRIYIYNINKTKVTMASDLSTRVLNGLMVADIIIKIKNDVQVLEESTVQSLLFKLNRRSQNSPG